MTDTVINLVEKCQQPEWAGMLAAGMLQRSGPFLRSTLSCSLPCCPTIKWGSSGVNVGRVWQVFSSEASSNPCPWLYDRRASLCHPAAGERQENNAHALPSTVSITLLSSTSHSQECSTWWWLPCPL